MTAFVHEDFLLGSDTARRLFHEHAKRLPIIDYHSHISARDLAADRSFGDLEELWLRPDPYKHRILRALGFAETLITGTASPRAKFDAWAAAAPRAVGNPLHHWAALELKLYFDITTPLSPATADEVWHRANAALAQPEFSARSLLSRANVEVVCTSDRLLDDLDDHAALARSAFRTRVLPSLRADDVLGVESTEFVPYVQQLGAKTGTSVATLDGLLQGLERRLDHFAQHGCRLSDHGIDVFDYASTDEAVAAAVYRRVLAGARVASAEHAQLRSFVLAYLAAGYARRGWIMQMHLGAQRTTSTRLRQIAGGPGGYATIGRQTDISRVCRFLDDLERKRALPRTILYTLNPADNAAFAALTGSFTAEGAPGLIQFGPAWWFNDHAMGIRTHLETLANHALLWTFIGMTTDSRSLLSMSRHEYFRRILCDYIGEQVRCGALPGDEDLLVELVRRLCYQNARAALMALGSNE